MSLEIVKMDNISQADAYQSLAPGVYYNGGGGFQPVTRHVPREPIVKQPEVEIPEPTMVPVADWMSIPAVKSNCPRGLKYLTVVDQLLVKQKDELLEAFTCFEGNYQFLIKNVLGQNIYYAVEDNDWGTRNMCVPARAFNMKVFDNSRKEVIHMYRPLACSACCFTSDPHAMEVSAPPGNVIGSVEEEPTIGSTLFHVKNRIGENVLRIEGISPEFKVVSLTGETVGRISKQWSGLTREIFTDSDFFGITFPLNLDVRMKAVLLGATLLIDAMFFENK